MREALAWARAARSGASRPRRRLQPGGRRRGRRRARGGHQPARHRCPRDRPRRRGHGRRRRALGRPRAPRRRARLGGPRVPQRHSRARGRHAHPERRRLRPGGQRDDRGRARARHARAARWSLLSPADCRFTYRDSVFKSGEPGRWIVLDVRYRLRPGGAADGPLCRGGAAPRGPGHRVPVARRRAGERAGHPAREVDGARSGRSQPPELRLLLRESRGHRGRGRPPGRARAGAAPAALAAARRSREALGGLADRAGGVHARLPARGRSGSPRATPSPSWRTTAPARATSCRSRGELQEAVRARFGVALVPEPVFWGPARMILTVGPRIRDARRYWRDAGRSGGP